MALSLGTSTKTQQQADTWTRLRARSQAGAVPDPELEASYLQYGRYLMICGSRDSLPMGLQGAWIDTNDPGWMGDYHTDVNIQMNYWMADRTGLPSWFNLFPETGEEACRGGLHVFEGWQYYCTPRAMHPRSAKALAWTRVDHIVAFDAFRAVDLIAPRPLLMIVGREAVTSWTSVEVFQKVQGPKELAGPTGPYTTTCTTVTSPPQRPS